MTFTDPAILNYCEVHTTPPSEIRYQLERETYLKTIAPQMLSGRLQGQLLRLFSNLLRPRYLLEIGTFTGYAAICLAEGLTKDGVLHTIEANPELEHLIRKYITRAGFEEKIQLHIGLAEDIIPGLPHTWDLVFIDANKQDYLRYYELVIDQLRPGGIILVDNVLWSGKVTDQSSRDADADAIDLFNKTIQADARVENVMLPVRDGIMIIRKL